MILLCSGQVSDKAFEALLFLAETLSSVGQTVAIDARFAPPELSRHAKYEAAPFLADIDDIRADKVIVLGADRDVERMSLSNATQAFLMLEEGRKIEAEPSANS